MVMFVELLFVVLSVFLPLSVLLSSEVLFSSAVPLSSVLLSVPLLTLLLELFSFTTSVLDDERTPLNSLVIVNTLPLLFTTGSL